METLELLDRYIDNQLVQNQVLQLEKELKEDADLQQLLDSIIVSREAIRYSALTLKVRGLHEKYIDEVRKETGQDNVRPMPVHRTYSWALRIAASLLIGLLGYSSYEYAALDKDQVYSGKFISYQLPITRGLANHRSVLDSLYLSGNYAGVVQQFDRLLTKDRSDYFLTGMACLQRHAYAQAVDRFISLRSINKQQNEIYFGEETDYYLALAYLGAGQTNEAYTIFKAIYEAPKHLFHQSVTEIDLLKLNLLRLKA